MRIYTGTGDRGKTSLLSGERISKSHERVEAYGEMDELSAVLGMLACDLPESETTLQDDIRTVQSYLFSAGAWVATQPDADAGTLPVSFDKAHGRWLETEIDRLSKALPPLKAFILPGGSRASAVAHVARTVCRRVERRVVAVAASVSASPHAEELSNVLVFLNRLSDYLFVLARYCNHCQGIPDQTWFP